MRLLLSCAAIFLFTQIATAQSHNQSQADLAIAKELQNEFKLMVDAFLKDDMLAVSHFYSDDAIIASGSFQVKGRNAIDKYWAGLKGQGKAWTLTTNYVEVKKDLALHDGVSILTTTSNGKDVVSKSRFLVVWEKQKDGKWKITKDYYSFY